MKRMSNKKEAAAMKVLEAKWSAGEGGGSVTFEQVALEEPVRGVRKIPTCSRCRRWESKFSVVPARGWA